MGISASTFRGGDIYRNMGRNTAETANQGTASMEAQRSGGATSSPLGAASSPTAAPMSGSPVVVLLVILGALVALRVIARRTGDGADYEGIIPTVQNIALITLAAMVGSVTLKGITSGLPANNAVRAFIAAA